MKTLLKLKLAIIILFLSSSSTFAFRATSDSYRLEGEFTNFGGSNSSDNYSLTNSSGNYAGFANSTNFEGCTGFQCVGAQIPTITFSLGSTSINLGSLSTGSVSTQGHTISVTTILTSGYQVAVFDDGNLRDGSNDIDDVGDGAVTANNEEYGLATSKAGQTITQDTSCGSAAYIASAITTTPQSVASSSVDVTSDSTTLCYAASISGTTPSGSYQHTVTYIATGTF